MKSKSISLCQPGVEKSCGACCGLYNYQGGTRPHLEAMLRRRSEAFRRLGPLSVEKLESFSRWVPEGEPEGKLLETIYNCEYLGFLDPRERTVGCLLHPAQNRGEVEDFRSCSFYGAEICAGHFCLSYQKLTPEEMFCVVNSLDDWYLYGICITDIDFIKAFFKEASARLGEQPSLGVLERDRVRKAALDYFTLKVAWPYRTREEGRFGKYCFAEDEYREARIPYESWGIPPSRFDTIFLSLASTFSSEEEVREAEALVDRRIQAFVRACE
jgi:hypothetical protein